MYTPKMRGPETLLWFISGIGFSDWGNFYDHQRPHTACYLMAYQPPPSMDRQTGEAVPAGRARQGRMGGQAYLM